jgi:Zn-finger nucleic acid-binding protein
MKCPVCNTAELHPYERQGVEIDACPTCRGVWLDRGELDKIIDRASRYDGDDDRRTLHDPRQHRDSDDRDAYRPRRKSFWKELFD